MKHIVVFVFCLLVLSLSACGPSATPTPTPTPIPPPTSVPTPTNVPPPTATFTVKEMQSACAKQGEDYIKAMYPLVNSMSKMMETKASAINSKSVSDFDKLIISIRELNPPPCLQNTHRYLIRSSTSIRDAFKAVTEGKMDDAIQLMKIGKQAVDDLITERDMAIGRLP